MASRSHLFRLLLAEHRDPVPFHEQLAARTLADFPFETAGRTVVDRGCGPGHYTRALRRAGATVLPIDLDPTEFELPGGPPGGQIIADAMRLPLPSAGVDGVFCSNMLEHTPDPRAVLSELVRVLRPHGWAWVSWTNWYSPWGGHELSPFQYLGPRWALRAYTRLRGTPKNVPGVGLFPTHVGQVLRLVKAEPGLELLDARPRYWPRQRWIIRVPGVREVATWNCELHLQRAG
jgi:SAM-dependent methyltransferase